MPSKPSTQSPTWISSSKQDLSTSAEESTSLALSRGINSILTLSSVNPVSAFQARWLWNHPYLVHPLGVIFGDVERLMLWTLILRVSVGLKGSQL